MRKNLYIVLLLFLLIVATGCSFTMTKPVDVAEKLPSEEEATATPAPESKTPVPTFTAVTLQEEEETQPDDTPQVVETEAVVEEKKPALFFFYADWCSACNEMRPVIDKLKPEYSEKIRFVMVDVDDPEARELIAIAGVRAIPLTIFVTSPDGEVQQWIGPRPESVLRDAFDKALK